MRSLAALLLALALCAVESSSLVSAGEPDLSFTLGNASGKDRAVAVLFHALKSPGAEFALRDAAGNDLPAVYNKQRGGVVFLDSVKAGGETYTVFPGIASNAKLPAWKVKVSEGRRRPIQIGGRVVKSVRVDVHNGLFKVAYAENSEMRGELSIKSAKGKYRFRCAPLGSSSGSVMDASLAGAIEADQIAGKKHGRVFNALLGIPEKIEVLKPNPFQRICKAQCVAWVRRNDEKLLELYTKLEVEITLTWNSPVITLKSSRKHKKYFNHNGVYLNEIYVEKLPFRLQADDARALSKVKLKKGERWKEIEFKRSLWLETRTGATIVHQPDFKQAAVKAGGGGGMIVIEGRLLTVISQSWGKKWRAVEQPAGEVKDTLTLVCDVGKSKKKLSEWIAEIDPEEK